jgi:hypothetical protein
MKKSAGAALLALALLLSIALSLPSSAAAKKRKAWPNLVITKIVIKQLPGDPPYVLEDESGHTPAFAVFVTTKNVGRASSKRKTSTELRFEELNETRVRVLGQQIRVLKPGEASTKKFVVDLDFRGGVPPLGLLRVVATADAGHAVSESDDRNDLKMKRLLPVVAHSWKAVDFMLSENLSQAGFPGSLVADHTKACPTQCTPVTFRFSTFDESSKHFDYVPSGSLQAGWDFAYSQSGTNCSGHTTEARGPKDWPGSFWIDDGLDFYNANISVTSERPPAPAWISCNGRQILQVTWNLSDLDTYVGDRQFPRTDSPYCTRLKGHTEKTKVAGIKTTWQWTLQAVVPRQHPC